MTKLDVRHFLDIYETRMRLQDEGVTNPSPEIKKFTRELVEKLLDLPWDEEIRIENYSFYDSRGNLIATIPHDSGEDTIHEDVD